MSSLLDSTAIPQNPSGDFTTPPALAELIGNRWNYQQIAAALGCTERAIYMLIDKVQHPLRAGSESSLCGTVRDPDGAATRSGQHAGSRPWPPPERSLIPTLALYRQERGRLQFAGTAD